MISISHSCVYVLAANLHIVQESANTLLRDLLKMW